MRRAAATIIVLASGCSAIFGIDKIPYEGPGDGGGSGSNVVIDAAAPDDSVTDSFTITINAGSGAGAGKVTDNFNTVCLLGPSGSCVQSYPAGAKVTLTPMASSGAVFNIWEGACLHQNSNDNGVFSTDCKLNPTGGVVSVVADFEPNTLTILNLIPDITSSQESQTAVTASTPNGAILCATVPSAACIHRYGSPTPISQTVAAKVHPGCTFLSQFRNLTCSSTAATCTVQFTTTQIQTVNFFFDVVNPTTATDCPL